MQGVEIQNGGAIANASEHAAHDAVDGALATAKRLKRQSTDELEWDCMKAVAAGNVSPIDAWMLRDASMILQTPATPTVVDESLTLDSLEPDDSMPELKALSDPEGHDDDNDDDDDGEGAHETPYELPLAITGICTLHVRAGCTHPLCALTSTTGNGAHETRHVLQRDTAHETRHVLQVPVLDPLMQSVVGLRISRLNTQPSHHHHRLNQWQNVSHFEQVTRAQGQEESFETTGNMDIEDVD